MNGWCLGFNLSRFGRGIICPLSDTPSDAVIHIGRTLVRMTEDMWKDVDLPVLKAAVELCDEGRESATTSDIKKRTGFDEKKVMASLLRLDGEQPPLFANMNKMFGGGVSHVFAPTGHARRTVRQWPQAEDKLEELIKVLTALSEQEPDPEKSKRLAKVREHLMTGGRDLAISVISGLVTGS